MDKREYLELKKTNQMKIIYHYYKEKFNKKKHKHLLSEGQFYTYIQANYDLNSLYAEVSRHYDTLFTVITIMDAEGNILSVC